MFSLAGGGRGRGFGGHGSDRFASSLPTCLPTAGERGSALNPTPARIGPPSVDPHHHGPTAPASPPSADWLDHAHNNDDGARALEQNCNPRSTNDTASSPARSLPNSQKRCCVQLSVRKGQILEGHMGSRRELSFCIEAHLRSRRIRPFSQKNEFSWRLIISAASCPSGADASTADSCPGVRWSSVLS